MAGPSFTSPPEGWFRKPRRFRELTPEEQESFINNRMTRPYPSDQGSLVILFVLILGFIGILAFGIIVRNLDDVQRLANRFMFLVTIATVFHLLELLGLRPLKRFVKESRRNR